MEYGAQMSTIKTRKNDIRTLAVVLTGHCLRQVSRLGILHNDYCINYQEIEEEENIRHPLCECNALYRKIIATISREFLVMSRKRSIKLFILMSLIRSTGWFKADIIERDFSPGILRPR